LDVEIITKEKEAPKEIAEKTIDAAFGEEKKISADKKTDQAEIEKEKSEVELTELMVGQEENPPVATEEEISELEKGK